MSKHIRARGEALIEWDVKNGEFFDVLLPEARHVVQGWIIHGNVKAVWLGTPREGYAPLWSRMPHALRSPSRPLRLSGLVGADFELHQKSNRLGTMSGLIRKLRISSKPLEGRKSRAESCVAAPWPHRLAGVCAPSGTHS